MKAKIAEVTGAECEELWLSGQTKEQALNSYITAADIRTSYRGKKKLIRSRGIDSD